MMAVKNPDFKDEQEWRILVPEDLKQLPFQHGCDADGRPFVELPVCTPATVVEVVLGPEFEQSIDAAREVLAKANLDSTRVLRWDGMHAPLPGRSSTPA
jgi:hypothetical protein